MDTGMKRKYVPKGYSEIEKPDLFESLSRKLTDESEVWLIQLPPEIKRVSDLQEAEWSLIKEFNEDGEIGVLRFPEGPIYGIRIEKGLDLTRTAINSANEDHPVFQRFVVIYRKKIVAADWNKSAIPPQ